MMQVKKYKIMSIFLGIGIVCSVCLAFSDERETNELSEQSHVITEISAGQIQAAVLKNETGSIGLWNLPEGVMVEGGNTENYLQSKLVSLIYQLSHMKAERIIESAEPELAELTEEEPLAVASLLLPEETIRLYLGRKSPVSEEYYLKKEKDPELYMVNAEIAEMMCQPADDLRDLSLYPSLSEENLKDLSQITITNRDGRMVLKQISTNTISSFFGLTEPVTAALNWENVDMQILNPIRQLQAEHFVSDDVPLEKYGLDNPEYQLELILAGKKYTCGFARKNEDTWYCADLEGTLVSEVGSEQVEFLNSNFMDLMGSSIYSFSMADLERLSANYEGRQVTMEIAGEGSSLIGTIENQIENKQLDHLKIMEFYDKINAIPVAAVLDQEKSITEEPLLTISFTLRSGKEDILEFYPISNRQCAVFVNGTAEFSTYTTVTTDIKKAFDQISQE